MPATSNARADWFPPGFQLPSPTTLSSVNSNYVVSFLRLTWNGLALFAVLVIVRNTVRKISARRRRKNKTTNTIPATNTECHRQYPPLFQNTATHLHGKRAVSSPPLFEPYQDHHFSLSAPRPFWMMAGRSGGSPGDDHLPHRIHQGSSLGAEEPSLSVVPGQAESSAAASGEGAHQGYIMTRPPPPPPLTPPAPSQPPVFAPEHGALGASLMHQPNPDYLSHTASSSSPPSENSKPEASRKSHSRAFPVSIPTPPPLQTRNSDSTTSSDEARFSPRSFPSPTPFLPPPPPAFDENGKSVDVQGEVVSVTDGFGAGWTRHTRVYGGGVCLACAASGGEGGFYGATALRPEGS